RAARGEITGYIDVDLEVHCRYIPSLVRAIEKGADVATLRRIYAFQLWHLDRYVMSRGYSWLVRRLLATRLHDTETGYKFFRRAPAPPLRTLLLRLYGARIGRKVVLHDVRFFNLYRRGLPGLRIGDECFLGDECLLDLAESIEMAEQVTLAERVLILTHTNVG